VSGIEVDNFDYQGVSTATEPVCADLRRINSLHVCIDKSPTYGVLVVQVETSARKSLTIQIGLAGSGADARTILYSISRPK
jgi:hypothetical protein